MLGLSQKCWDSVRNDGAQPEKDIDVINRNFPGLKVAGTCIRIAALPERRNRLPYVSFEIF